MTLGNGGGGGGGAEESVDDGVIDVADDDARVGMRLTGRGAVVEQRGGFEGLRRLKGKGAEKRRKCKLV